MFYSMWYPNILQAMTSSVVTGIYRGIKTTGINRNYRVFRPKINGIRDTQTSLPNGTSLKALTVGNCFGDIGYLNKYKRFGGYRSSCHQEVSPPVNSPPLCTCFKNKNYMAWVISWVVLWW